MSQQSRWVLIGMAAIMLSIGASPAAAGLRTEIQDLVFANILEEDRVCAGIVLFPGEPIFTCSDADPQTNVSFGVALGDLDADSDLDVVIAKQGPGNRVCLNDGSAAFTCTGFGSDAFTRDVALGFVNADANLDAVFANSGNPNPVCFGNGSGGFGSCSNVESDGFQNEGVALGDLNGDTHLDAVFSTAGLADARLCLGNGTGGFACGDLIQEFESSRAVAIGDVDGDGDLDVVLATEPGVFPTSGPNRVCLNNGAAVFTCSNTDPQSNVSVGVALDDLNGDGDLDAVFAIPGGPNRACLGNGAGGFSCSDVSGDTFQSTGVALGDTDGDGNLDAVFSNDGERNRVCVGDGVGGFTTCRDISTDANASQDVALGELREVLLNQSGTIGDMHDPMRVVCRNSTTGQTVSGILTSPTEWDCAALGLITIPGDRIHITLSGLGGFVEDE